MTRGQLHPTSTRRTQQTHVAVGAWAIIGDTFENCQAVTPPARSPEDQHVNGAY